MAVLEGDPAKEGPFTIRLSLPAGFKVPPHWHPNIEHTTVISGTLNLGMGDKFDKTKGNNLPAGSFSFVPPKTNHFIWTEEGCVLQVHSIGPGASSTSIRPMIRARRRSSFQVKKSFSRGAFALNGLALSAAALRHYSSRNAFL